MEHKNLEITRLLKSIEDNNIGMLDMVDFWDADTMAIGFRFGEKLLYVSSYNYIETKNYNIIVEHFDTGEIIEPEKNINLDNLLVKIKELSLLK